MIIISVWGQKVDSDRYFKQVWTSLRLPRQPFYQTSGFYLRIYCSLIELTFSYIFSGLYIFLLIFCSVLWILISRCTKFLFITRQRELLQSRWSAMAAKCMFQALLLTKLVCWCNSTMTKDKRTYLLKAFITGQNSGKWLTWNICMGSGVMGIGYWVLSIHIQPPFNDNSLWYHVNGRAND